LNDFISRTLVAKLIGEIDLSGDIIASLPVLVQRKTEGAESKEKDPLSHQRRKSQNLT